jgi:hypothetical protein
MRGRVPRRPGEALRGLDGRRPGRGALLEEVRRIRDDLDARVQALVAELETARV